jgi:FK506-binding nuclear protein
MQVGGERLLTIPPNMGYGKKDNKDIPANSTLIFGKALHLLPHNLI